MANATHQWSGAPAINTSANRLSGENYKDRAYPDSTFDTAVTDPPPGLTGFRAAFWSCTLTKNMNLTNIGAMDSQFDNGYCGLWYKSGGVWQTVVPMTLTTISGAAITLNAGVTYYLGVSLANSTKTSATNLVTFYMAAVTYNYTLPPVKVRLGIQAPTVPTSPTVNVPQMLIYAFMMEPDVTGGGGAPDTSWATINPAVVQVVMLAPAISGGSAPQPWPGTFQITTPLPGDVTTSARPSFVVAVDVDGDEDYQAVIQYDTTGIFTSPATMLGNFTGVDGGTIITPSSDLPPAIYWRARLLENGEPVTDWTTTATLIIDTATEAYELSVTWDVDASATTPIHLWHFTPSGPDVGDEITIYGQGFPSYGELTFDGSHLTITGWTLQNARPANADDTTRVINGETVTPEHSEVTFVAPDSSAALAHGGSLTLKAI